MNVARLILPLSSVLLILMGESSDAATGKILFAFKGLSRGANPQAEPYIGANGDLYGTLSDYYSHNKHENGLVYQVSRGKNGWVQKTLHQFHPNQGDGAMPTGALIADASGALYGTTLRAGAHGRDSDGGIVFKLTPPVEPKGDWSESILYSFNGRSEGAFPGGGLIFDSKGTLYLTHQGGGNKFGNGTVSMLIPPSPGSTAWTNATIYTFKGGSDGQEPSSEPLVFDADGALYGVTQNGGGGVLCSNGGEGCGTVYKLTPPRQGKSRWTKETLYAFTGGADGGLPNSNLVFDGNGNLFSTTFSGGADNVGTVFELSPPANGQTSWTETVIYSFSTTNVHYPLGNTTITSDGDLLIAASGGGAGNAGAIIELKPSNGNNSWSEKVLYAFNGQNGEVPTGEALDSIGNIFGTTETGPGADGFGIAFRITP